MNMLVNNFQEYYVCMQISNCFYQLVTYFEYVLNVCIRFMQIIIYGSGNRCKNIYEI